MNLRVCSQLNLVVLLLTFITINSPVLAYSEEEILKVFRMLDSDEDGKVTRGEYAFNKVQVFYRKIHIAIDRDALSGGDVSFAETSLSRQFFNDSDTDHNGLLSAVEVNDALVFDRIDNDSKGYFTLENLRAFMNRIGG